MTNRTCKTCCWRRPTPYAQYGTCNKHADLKHDNSSCSEWDGVAEADTKTCQQLKPCPFCGGEATIWSYGNDVHEVTCNACDAASGTHEGKLVAVSAWNNRAATVDQEALELAKDVQRLAREMALHVLDLLGYAKKAACENDADAWAARAALEPHEDLLRRLAGEEET